MLLICHSCVVPPCTGIDVRAPHLAPPECVVRRRSPGVGVRHPDDRSSVPGSAAEIQAVTVARPGAACRSSTTRRFTTRTWISRAGNTPVTGHRSDTRRASSTAGSPLLLCYRLVVSMHVAEYRGRRCKRKNNTAWIRSSRGSGWSTEITDSRDGAGGFATFRTDVRCTFRTCGKCRIFSRMSAACRDRTCRAERPVIGDIVK